MASCPPPVLSATLFSIPAGPGRWVVYAPLRRAAFVANSALVNQIAALGGGGSADLDPALAEWLRRVEILDSGGERLPDAEDGPFAPTTVTLLLTTCCNLRCSYCYARSGDTPAEWMSPALARCAIDFVAENAVHTGTGGFEVGYHGGGEPSLNWRTLTESWEYAGRRARELSLTVGTSLATNGVIEPERAEWVARHLDSACVSIDGPPEVHDAGRRDLYGLGTGTRVAETLGRFDGTGFPYGIRMTVTPAALPRLPESVEYLCSRFLAQDIQVEPVYTMGRWEGGAEASAGAFVEAFREARAIALHYGRNLMFSAARAGLLTRHFCAATRDGFAVTASGKVSACYEVFSESNPGADLFRYGEFIREDGAFRFEREKLRRLRSMEVENRPECHGCFARWHCAGDCLNKRNTAARCHITRELLRDEILANIARSGGLFWHEPR